MITHVALKQLDHDFRILKQLSVYDHHRIYNSNQHATHSRIHMLMQERLIISQRGNKGGYQLTRPLTTLYFSHWLTHRPALQQPGPTLTLLKQFSDTPVGDMLTWTPFMCGSYTLLFDHAVGILACLSSTTFRLPKDVVYPLGTGYISHIFTKMAKYELIHTASRKGGRLTKPFEKITVRDVAPVLSPASQVFSSLVCHAGSVKLAALLDNQGGQ